MLKLNFKKKHFFTHKIGKNAQGKPEALVLVPGVNEVSEELWEKCKKDGVLSSDIQIFFDNDLLSFMMPQNKNAVEQGVEDSKVEESTEDDVVAEMKKKRGPKTKGNK